MSDTKNIQKLHKPVMVREVLEAFGIDDNFAHSQKRKKIIDATLGIGGHTEELIKLGFDVLGIDQDSEMLKLAKERLMACPTPENNIQGSYKLVEGSFKDIEKIAKKNGFIGSNGVLFDLGVSSPQITSKLRGMSFQYDMADLDMRLDRQNMAIKGSDLLNVLRLDQLQEMFSRVMGFDLSKKLAQKVIDFRDAQKFETVGDFKTVIDTVLIKKGKKSAYTLPFLALRIAVNSELEAIKDGINGAFDLLQPGGRIVAISFHSSEDKIVKKAFLDLERSGGGEVINKKPITPDRVEIAENVRSRSALLRVFEKNERTKKNN